MNIFLKKYLKKILGIILILGGIAGLFLPGLQGIAMILAGSALLGSKLAAKIFRKLKKFIKLKKR